MLLASVVGMGRCGDARRRKIKGTIHFDAQLIPDGSISFVPQGDAPGPTAGAVIAEVV